MREGDPASGSGTGRADGPTRRSRTPSANVEQELLATAEAVLVRDGPGGLTVRAVAAEADIARMGVYNRPGGKEGLINALLMRGFDRLRAAIEVGLEPAADSDMLARLSSCSLRYREFALANPHFYAIMFEDAIPRKRDNQCRTRVPDHTVTARYACWRRFPRLQRARGHPDRRLPSAKKPATRWAAARPRADPDGPRPRRDRLP